MSQVSQAENMDELVVGRTPGNLHGTILLFLALNLILLVFFVLLNTMSSPSKNKIEQQSELVFDKARPQKGDGGDLENEPPAWQGWLHARLLAPVNGTSILEERQLMADAQSLWVTFPASQFFEEESAVLKGTALGLIQNVAALANLEGQHPLRMDVSVRMPAEKRVLATQRVVGLGQAILSSAGKNTAVAVQLLGPVGAPKDEVVFTFRARGANVNVERAAEQLQGAGGATGWMREKQ